jgi:alpha-beta hydrolase superfamily lysophospholipase
VTTSFRLCILVMAGLLSLAALWLAGDAFHARWIFARASAPDARRAATTPFTLNASGSPVLLLIHGFADGPCVFAPIAPLLAESGFAVQAMHLHGAGVPPAEMKGTTLQTWREDIDHEIAALRAQAPSCPIWLVGHSLGGTLAFDAALRPENHIAGLILLAPLIKPSDVRSPLLASNQWFRLLDHALVFSEVVESRLPADLHDPEARAHYQTDRYIHRDIYRALFAAIAAIRSRAADWRGPLLMIVSPSDQIVDTSAATTFFFAATNAAPARLSEHHAGGHVLPLDRGYDKIAGKIIRFIRDTSRQP